VKSSRGKAVAIVVICASQFFGAPAWAKEKEAAEKIVDSGSFGVFNSSHRVATETFSIKQGAEGSVVSSEFKSEQGEQKAQQTSELQLTPSVELRQYAWKELLPEKTEATVLPNDTFLIERFGTGSNDKQHEQNFLLPASTSILDDYFFIQREVLAWKYLATACRQEKGGLGCPLKQKVQFGTLNPHARSSMPVSIEFTGREKLTIRGSEHELNRFILRSESGDWAFWLDDEFKLVRLLADGGTEVVRD
jgi:hypothetical protein